MGRKPKVGSICGPTERSSYNAEMGSLEGCRGCEASHLTVRFAGGHFFMLSAGGGAEVSDAFSQRASRIAGSDHCQTITRPIDTSLFLLKKTFLVYYSLFYELSPYILQESIM